ncbi:short-chain dehydrogenase/reductase family 42E member 1-like isoform X2 [Camellia sinensis]|uniref:short-chain dehydrogenase/reductase family 42E member 1-like isoform X2 n=1 Tax=Camellia sinensis TaxID=4442 RepID=UPI00103654E3|nr:short-chain dehydrogenase/reductase family 42E member 1-like isoform X2 [Camellia sinensis]
MHLSKNEGIEDKTFVVAGGLGFVGSSLCLELLRRGAHQVRTFDLRTTSPCSHHLFNKGVHCIPNCVFHRASYGMSGKEMLQFGRVDDVNINGTCHVLEACVEHGVKRLVYVSTYNVVFGGKEIINGNETLPYFPLHDYVDPYSRNKCIAKQLVLKSNGRPLKKKNGNLYTCAIRPAAIYGPGSPVNSFEFLRPLLQSLEYDLPKWSLAVSHALVLGRIFQLVYTILYPWLNQWWLPQPLMLPTEVHEVGVTHYFSFLKAKEELGYVPMVSPQEGMAATISYFQERKMRSLDGPTIYTWMFSVIGMTLLFIAVYWPAFGPVSLLRDFCLFFFRSMWVMRMVFILATAAHIGEAVYAWHLAKKVDPLNAGGWFWQTLALGVFSLRFLLKRARK